MSPSEISALEHAPFAYWVVQPDGVVSEWNRAAQNLFGYRADEAVGAVVDNLIVPEQSTGIFGEDTDGGRDTGDGEDSDGREQRVVLRGKNGRDLTVDLTLWRTPGHPGRHAFARDAGAVLAREREHDAAEEQWRVAFEHAPVGMAVNDLSDLDRPTVLSANRKFLQMIGHSLADLRKIGPRNLTPSDDREGDLGAILGLLDGSLASYRKDKRYAHADGTVVWGRLTASIARGSDGTPYMISQVEDITEARAAESARRQAESLLSIAFKHAPHGTAILGLRGEDRGRLMRVNPALITMTRRENLIGAPLASVLDDDAGDVLADFEQLAEGERDLVEHVCRMRAGGGHIFTQVSITLSRDDDGRPEHALAQLRDITQQHAHEEWLTRHAKTDALTGLANRLAMRERLVQEIDALRAGTGLLVVIMIDLDNFKKVNDTLGHEVGDELLRRVGEALVRALPPHALAARLGGDEFVVIAPEQQPDEISGLLEVITAAIDGAGADLEARIGVRVSGSLGHAGTRNPATAPEDLIRGADQAMYQAKRSRSGTPDSGSGSGIGSGIGIDVEH